LLILQLKLGNQYLAEIMDPSGTRSIGSILQAAIYDAGQTDLSWIQPPPSDYGWTLAPDALRFISQVIRHFQPRHVLEFGSGLSTQVLARAATGLERQCSISSVDHDPEFGAAAEESSLRHAGKMCNLALQTAPLVVRVYGNKLVPAYLIKPGQFASNLPVDLVLIDGPPAVLGGREGTLYQAMDYLKPGALLLLDDSERREERATLANWQEMLGSAIEVTELTGFTRGMAAIIVHEPVRSTELWAHRQRVEKRRFVNALTACDLGDPGA
jgi:predicted O-methyltransferase YrrM